MALDFLKSVLIPVVSTNGGDLCHRKLVVRSSASGASSRLLVPRTVSFVPASPNKTFSVAYFPLRLQLGWRPGGGRSVPTAGLLGSGATSFDISFTGFGVSGFPAAAF